MTSLQHALMPLAGLAVLVASVTVHAQPTSGPPGGLPSLTVVADHGGEPARPYYVAIGMADVEESEGYAPHLQGPVAISERDMLPVESRHLSPGQIAARSLDLPPGTTPFFLIGDDDLSYQWLAQRGDILREQNAVGLVVQVADADGLERLRAAAPGLELRPMSGDDLAQRIGLSHYPVLITAHGLEQ